MKISKDHWKWNLFKALFVKSKNTKIKQKRQVFGLVFFDCRCLNSCNSFKKHSNNFSLVSLQLTLCKKKTRKRKKINKKEKKKEIKKEKNLNCAKIDICFLLQFCEITLARLSILKKRPSIICASKAKKKKQEKKERKENGKEKEKENEIP